MERSYSQFGQDKWVLSKIRATATATDGPPPFYVEFGCADGVDISNTYLLEQSGWRGVGVDFNPRNVALRKNLILKGVVWDSSTTVDFVDGADLGGIASTLGKWKDALMNHGCQTVKAQTFTPLEVLQKAQAPSTIDYMSLDIEGAELVILKAFPWKDYTVRCITVEHNNEEPKRTDIREFLLKKGFVLDTTLAEDDCYISVATLYGLASSS